MERTDFRKKARQQPGDPEPAKSFFRLAFTMVPIEEIEPGIAALGRAIAASAG